MFVPVNFPPPKPGELGPSCIVIGCKHGSGGGTTPSTTKFYKVPSISTNLDTQLQLAKQWYINTLREDLLDELTRNNNSSTTTNTTINGVGGVNHFVCIEHFDEESFANPSPQISQSSELKADAVPSLFEIEVFQKMIAHQEKIAQQQHQLKQQQMQQNQHQKFALLSSLILNSNNSGDEGGGATTSTTGKKTRLDADERAALIERVPKAVKRTALISANQYHKHDEGPKQKLAKAVKHTQPMGSFALNDKTNRTTTKFQKAVKHTSALANSQNLKEIILPPPIMQSTRPRPSAQPVSGINQNKVTKYGSLIASAMPGSSSSNSIPPENNLSVSSLNNTAATTILSSQQQPTKVTTITTTYVYKRVTQEPDIDLNMECEEEEIEYIRMPPSPPPPPQAPSPSPHSTLAAETTSTAEEAVIKKSNDPGGEVATTRKSLSKMDGEKEKSVKARTGLESFKKEQETKTKPENASKSGSYKFTLEKYYCRRQGALHAAIKSKSSHVRENIPHDLRVGNYPAKCNVCSLVLANNIELTSHICSHLETIETGETEQQNTYISPFDAVTTTCGLCEMTFTHPFDLIKHLDLTHLKQLAEYKCRICEKQHTKLNELVNHLEREHKSQEMPYRCDACGFRTSFYADAIYHIKKEHTNTLRHFCPYCLKSLVLPYQKKLGHVQCNLFYAHLQTHFNKQENDTIQPSKCKHCTKCILHVRFMNEHLAFDHSSNMSSTNIEHHQAVSTNKKSRTATTENEKNIDPDWLNKSKVAAMKHHGTTLLAHSASDTAACGLQTSGKRKRSNSINAKQLGQQQKKSSVTPIITSASTTTKPPTTVIDEYDFESNEYNNRNTNETEIKESQQSTLSKQPHGSKKVTATKPTEYSSLIKKYIASNTTKNVKPIEEDKDVVGPSELVDPAPNENEEHLNNTPTEEQGDEIGDPPKVKKRVQKALKQTTMKKFVGRGNVSVGRRGGFRGRSATNVENEEEFERPESPTTGNFMTTVFFGNVRFSCPRSQFKCVECGHSDLKSHYRNDYTCHQCHYNTSCSRSFEFHLHGHLNKKRVAMWNKVIAIDHEEYSCPCGFSIKSTTEANSTTSIGNKFADHLLNCDYKYCFFRTKNLDNSMNQVNSEQPPSIKNELEKKNETVREERLNMSEGIIIEDSSEEIID